MDNYKKLFLSNGKSNKRLTIKNKRLEYTFMGTEFNGEVIKDILQFVNVANSKFYKIPIFFNLGEIRFTDKLTYILFECICNYLIVQCKTKVNVSFKVETSIYTLGIISSPVTLLAQKNESEKFIKAFNSEIYKLHYRKVIKFEEYKDIYLLSKLMTDIDSFLKSFNVIKQNRNAIAEVIVELVGNVFEHAETDCLIDLDVTENSFVKDDCEDLYYGINIAILNFSDKLLGSGIAEKIKAKEMLNERHENLLFAYNLHSKNFDSNYNENDFFNLASFQYKISGRMSKEHTGGTGLKKLISRLEDYSDDYLCYVLSGDRIVFFEKDYLKYNEDNWIGFNDENDFLNNIPKKELLGRSITFMPGTAYNLNFVMKMEE